jgi:predicted DNA-binding transcriptional regulator AlpA
MTSNDVDDMPPVIDLPAAARLLGIGRTAAYELVRTDAWPTPVLRLGRLIRIPSAPLLDLLGIPPVSRTQRTRTDDGVDQ